MIYVFLADGFEECEAITPTDILRRAGLETVTVKVGGEVDDGSLTVMGAHGIPVTADIHERQYSNENAAMIVLPGGGGGVENLYKSCTVKNAAVYCAEHKIPIGAICAAPSILARLGCLKNIKATAYPSFRHYLDEGGAVTEENAKVVTDGIFTTAAAAGVSVEFGLELARVLCGGETSGKIGGQILFY